MKILHLINDHQVIERTLGVYEGLFPNQNEILIFSETNKYKHLKKYSSFTRVTSNNLRKVAKEYNFGGITHIIAHYMTMEKIDFIKFIPSQIHVCWEVYGYDLYNQFLEPNGFRISDTPRYKYYKYSFARIYFPTLFNMALYFKGYRYVFKWQKNRQFHYISNRIDSIQFCCSYDAKFIEEFSHRQISSYEVFNYSLSEVLGDLRDSPFTVGNNILLGNSASFSNNHLYVLRFLKRIGLDSEINLIMPLSYGGTVRYRNDVENQYNEVFPGRVRILKKYIPLHEYNKMFLDVNSCIMAAWRQESIGTIIMCLYLGIKVFMSNRNPLFKWLVECKFKVFELELATRDSLETPLDDNIRQYNRKLVLERYNEDQVAKNLIKHIN